MTRVVVRVTARSEAEAPDAAEQFVGIQAGADLAGRGGGLEELTADRDQPVEEIGVQRLEGGGVGLQHFGQAVLGDQEVDEEVNPASQGGVRCAAVRQQRRTGLSARRMVGLLVAGLRIQ